jgi:hypothetical protein
MVGDDDGAEASKIRFTHEGFGREVTVQDLRNQCGFTVWIPERIPNDLIDVTFVIFDYADRVSVATRLGTTAPQIAGSTWTASRSSSSGVPGALCSISVQIVCLLSWNAPERNSSYTPTA